MFGVHVVAADEGGRLGDCISDAILPTTHVHYTDRLGAVNSDHGWGRKYYSDTPNLNSVLNDQIRCLTKREIKGQTRILRKLTAQHRRDLAALKRQVAGLGKAVKYLARNEKKRAVDRPVIENAETIRFRADGLESHRSRLGLSAAEYGRLVGASDLSVYH